LRGKSIGDAYGNLWAIDNDGSEPHAAHIQVPHPGIYKDVSPGEVPVDDLRGRVVKIGNGSGIE
jgi:hypothetical protein